MIRPTPVHRPVWEPVYRDVHGPVWRNGGGSGIVGPFLANNEVILVNNETILANAETY